MTISACVDTPKDNFSRPGRSPQKLSPYVLWRSYEGSASARGLPPSTILDAASVAQNLFATGQIGQKASWQSDSGLYGGEIVLMEIVRPSSVPCVQYGQKIDTPQQTRHSQGIACLNSFNVWQIVEEYPLDPPPRMF